MLRRACSRRSVWSGVRPLRCDAGGRGLLPREMHRTHQRGALLLVRPADEQHEPPRFAAVVALTVEDRRAHRPPRRVEALPLDLAVGRRNFSGAERHSGKRHQPFAELALIRGFGEFFPLAAQQRRALRYRRERRHLVLDLRKRDDDAVALPQGDGLGVAPQIDRQIQFLAVVAVAAVRDRTGKQTALDPGGHGQRQPDRTDYALGPLRHDGKQRQRRDQRTT